MKNLVRCLLAAATFLPLSIQASTYHLTTVKWIVDHRNQITYDDHYVTMVGHVTRRMGDEEYWFTDGTGSIRLDSENFDLPIERRIVVGGRIDEAYLGFGHIEVDVRAWHYPVVHTTATAAKTAPTKAASTASTPSALKPAPAAPPATLAPPPVSTEIPAPSTVPPTPITTPTTPAPASGPVSDTTLTAPSTTAPDTSVPSTNIAVPSLNPPAEPGK